MSIRGTPIAWTCAVQMARGIRTREVEPVAMATGWACDGPTGLRPVYPPTPEGIRLRDAREESYVSLREAAAEAGMSAVEWGEIERGRRVPADRDGWARLQAVVRAVETRRGL